jgi:hypothetical protein
MPRDPKTILQEEFLLARSKILELAATLDRIDRASREASNASLDTLRKESKELTLLYQALDILQEQELHRAQRVQELMSRPYDPAWRTPWTI